VLLHGVSIAQSTVTIKARKILCARWPEDEKAHGLTTAGCRAYIKYRMTLSYSNKVFRTLFLGFVRLHILYHASKEPVFGLYLMQELERHGYQISPGTLYPILHQMEINGFLASEKSVANGKMRKYYNITGEGKAALEESYSKIRELSEELNE
jgi:PadR family transcriptional regulator, regulatory protein PadR